MKFTIAILIIVCFISCKRKNNIYEEIEESLGKELNLSIVDTVWKGEQHIGFNEFREKYKYISVVCLKEGCEPCYPNFIKWQEKMDSVGMAPNSTLLFVIQGGKTKHFLKEVQSIKKLERDSYVVYDKNFKYSYYNKQFPTWVVNAGILINERNIVRLVGAPFGNEEMTKLYREICSQ